MALFNSTPSSPSSPSSPSTAQRYGFGALTAFAVISSLAACAPAASTATAGTGSTGGSSEQPAAGAGGSSGGSATYADGSYSAEGKYLSPGGAESIGVELTLKGDVVTAVTVTPNATSPNAIRYQGEFVGGIAAVVVGKNIDTLKVSRVAGSSLTSGGFNEAVATIKADATS